MLSLINREVLSVGPQSRHQSSLSSPMACGRAEALSAISPAIAPSTKESALQRFMEFSVDMLLYIGFSQKAKVWLSGPSGVGFPYWRLLIWYLGSGRAFGVRMRKMLERLGLRSQASQGRQAAHFP